MTGRRALRILVQALGAVLGVALFFWALRMAFTPENQASVRRLLDAPWRLVAAMILLNVATIIVNGLVFWVTSIPVKRVGVLSAILTNAVSSFLAFLPFKISALTRIYLHHRRDGVPLRGVVGWMIGAGLTALAAMVPVVAACALAPVVGGWWLVIAIAGAFACTAIGVWLARLADARIPWLRALSLGSTVVARNAWVMHAGCALRLLDFALQTGRFLVAASAMGLAVAPARAALDATVYFVIGAASPGGVLGFREGGLAWIRSLMSVDDDAAEQIALLALAVTGAEAATFCVLAVIAAAWMRLDRLVFRAAAEELAAEDAGLTPPPPAD